MQSREEPLTKRERAELKGYVSTGTAVGRAVLFLFAVAIVAALSRRLPAPLGLFVTAVFGLVLYLVSRRWTGGRELRRLIRLDLESNKAVVHHVRSQDAILFEENEDEGPVVFVLTDAGETLVFVGQELARHVARGFPWREFEIRESPSSRRFFGLQRRGEALPPSLVRPPLSRESYKRLAVDAVRSWQKLELAFDDLRRLS